MLKYILADVLRELDSRQSRKKSVMESCIDFRLNKSLELYEDNLKKTCEYLLSKNPKTMIKSLVKEFKGKEPEPVKDEEEDEDYEL